jgi:hypothetical protein
MNKTNGAAVGNVTIANDGRLPELIAKWKAKARQEEDDCGQRRDELKRSWVFARTP